MINFTDFSTNFLNGIVELGPFIISFINEIWLKIPEWIFIFISGVVGAYVAIKMDRIFQQKTRIHFKSFIKQSSSAALKVIVYIFFIFFMWAAAIIIIIGLIKVGMSYSPILTLVVLLITGLIFYFKRKKKKNDLVKRFKK